MIHSLVIMHHDKTINHTHPSKLEYIYNVNMYNSSLYNSWAYEFQEMLIWYTWAYLRVISSNPKNHSLWINEMFLRRQISHRNPINTIINPIALRKAKIVYNFGLSECNRVKVNGYTFRGSSSLIFTFVYIFNRVSSLRKDLLFKNSLFKEQNFSFRTAVLVGRGMSAREAIRKLQRYFLLENLQQSMACTYRNVLKYWDT